jgi:hypothetical protein
MVNYTHKAWSIDWPAGDTRWRRAGARTGRRHSELKEPGKEETELRAAVLPAPTWTWLQWRAERARGRRECWFLLLVQRCKVKDGHQRDAQGAAVHDSRLELLQCNIWGWDIISHIGRGCGLCF